MNFASRMLLFLGAALTACAGDSVFSPGEKEKMVEAIDQIRQITQEFRQQGEQDDNGDRGRALMMKLSAAQTDIEQTLSACARAQLVFKLPEKPDASRLPLEGLSERELGKLAAQGNADACLEMACRWLPDMQRPFIYATSRCYEGRWNILLQSRKWLDKAIESNRPGARFLLAVLNDDQQTPLQDMPGYDVFRDQLASGDILLARTAACVGPALEQHLADYYETLKKKGLQGDSGSRKNYALAALWCQENLVDFKCPIDRETALSWCLQLAEKGDMNAMSLWLSAIPGSRLHPDDIDRIMRYGVQLIESGYVKDLLELPHFNYLEIIDLLSTNPETRESTRNTLAAYYAERGSIPNLKYLLEKYLFLGVALWNRTPIGYLEQLCSLQSDAITQLDLARYYTSNPNEPGIAILENDVPSEIIAILQQMADAGQPYALIAQGKYYAGIQNFEKTYSSYSAAIAILKNEQEKGSKLFDDDIEAVILELVKLDLKRDLPREGRQAVFNRTKSICDAFNDDEGTLRKGSFLACLAYMYETGFGTETNETAAASAYARGAASGNSACLNNLGCMYEEGRGVKQNRNKALELYSQAAEQGHEEARQNRDRLLIKPERNH